MSVEVGDKAPDFALPGPGGKLISLKELRGRKVVLYFYPKDDTPGCTKEACSFRDFQPEFEKQNSIVLGVSPDSATSHQRFTEKYGLTFPLISDVEKKIVTAYGVWKKRSMYGRSFMGIERSTFIINEKGTISHVFRRVKVEGHTNEVLEALAPTN
jgi:thioredoxin-dependent peroxiredoxin